MKSIRGQEQAKQRLNKKQNGETYFFYIGGNRIVNTIMYHTELFCREQDDSEGSGIYPLVPVVVPWGVWKRLCWHFKGMLSQMQKDNRWLAWGKDWSLSRKPQASDVSFYYLWDVAFLSFYCQPFCTWYLR